MVAAVDEERVPALPVRNSSREFGRGASSTVKVAIAVIFGVVATVGFGAGVAIKKGLVSTVSAPAAASASNLGQTNAEKGKDFDQAHAEKEKEFLSMKDVSEDRATLATTTSHADVAARRHAHGAQDDQDTVTSMPHTGVAIHNKTLAPHRSMARNSTHHDKVEAQQEDNNTEARAKIGAYLKIEAQKKANQSKRNTSSHANQSKATESKANQSKAHNATAKMADNTTNEIAAANKTATENGTGAANQTGAHNRTNNGTNGTNSTNSTKADGKSRPHKDLACKGGSLAACQCIFACKVFGGQPSQCSGGKVDLVDTLIQKALSSAKYACLGMQCVVRCAKSLQCYDENLKHDCRALANGSIGLDTHTHSKGGNCRYECEETTEEDFLTQ